ncbi:MAG: hypothetical protein U0703_18545 [Anaerolineae bacterium]
MAKKKATNQPIVAEEPARTDDQLRLDESKVAPPSSRPIGPRTTSAGARRTYGARSARERRAERSVRTGSSARRERKHDELSQEVVAELLEHPTLTVSEDELRRDYSYVVADLRSMALLAAGLIITLVVLAQILPK